MNIRVVSLLVLVGIALVWQGCKKDDDETPDRTTLLTDNPWRLDDVTTNPDITAFYPDADSIITSFIGASENSTITFNADGTYVLTDATSGTTDEGTWTFNTDQTELTITDFGTDDTDYTFELTELTESRMVGSTQVSEDLTGTGIPVTIAIIITFIAA